MITVIPRRYDAPKWQANVPESNVFVCQNGLVIRNIFGLKQAISTLPDAVLSHHVSEGRHDFADWVKHSVKDEALSEVLRPQTHRWGIIVTLERQLMRTLNLPDYVAQRWLSPVNKDFVFSGGSESANSLQSLLEKLNQVSDDVVKVHLERIPNDIAKWVNDEVGDYPLAEVLAEAPHRQQMISVVEDHLAMLHDAAE